MMRAGLLRGGLARVAPLLQTPRYEVLPAASTEQAVLDWVPKELTVTVTASPAKGLEDTLALAERLQPSRMQRATTLGMVGSRSALSRRIEGILRGLRQSPRAISISFADFHAM